jgi:hypothetical protein
LRLRALPLLLALWACEQATPPPEGPPAISPVRPVRFVASQSYDPFVTPFNHEDSATVAVQADTVIVHGRVSGGYQTDRIYYSLVRLGDTLFLDPRPRGGIPFASHSYYHYTLTAEPQPSGPLRVAVVGLQFDTIPPPDPFYRTFILDTVVALAVNPSPLPPFVAPPAVTTLVPARFLIDDSLEAVDSLAVSGDSAAAAVAVVFPAWCNSVVGSGSVIGQAGGQLWVSLTRLGDTIWVDPRATVGTGPGQVRHGYRLEVAPLPAGQYRYVVTGAAAPPPSGAAPRQILLDTTLTLSQGSGCVT